MAKLAGLLWDLDGVLVDTSELHYRSWQEALTEHDVELSRAEFRETFGMNNAGILRRLLGERYSAELYRQISEKKESAFRDSLKGNVALLPGARALLIAAREAGISQAIASSAPLANIQALVDELRFAEFFDALVSGAEMPGKPNPDVFLEAARRIDAPASSCLVIEDAVAGVQAAHRAGMKCLAVTTTNSRQDLAEADRIVDSLEAVGVADLSAFLD
jgi:beta-phosphoglucomutase family hydrolase